MRELRILHAADLHLDSPFQALPGDKAAIRRAEQRNLLSRLAALVAEERIDLVLLSGDVLDGNNPYYETCEQLLQCLGAMAVPVFIAPGNHDYYSASSFYARTRLPENVHVFTGKEIECIPLTQLQVRVYGAAFTDRHSEAMLAGFQAPQDQFLNVMCIHGETDRPESPYNPICESDIETSGLDYLALGHIHTASGLRKAGKVNYAWPGCPEGRGFDETGDKSVYIVTLTKEHCEITPRSVASRRYITLKVDVTGTDPLLAVNTAVPEDADKDIYRIALCGETEEAPNLAVLHAALEDLFFELQLQDATTIYQSIWAKAGEDTLRGLFLEKLRRQYDEAESETERMRIESAVRWGLAALDNREEVVSHEDQ